jgi:hypothetical protein
VQHRAVLYIALRADADRVYVASYHRIHPNAGLFTENNVPDQLCGGVDITACWNDWFQPLVTPDHEVRFYA